MKIKQTYFLLSNPRQLSSHRPTLLNHDKSGTSITTNRVGDYIRDNNDHDNNGAKTHPCSIFRGVSAVNSRRPKLNGPRP